MRILWSFLFNLNRFYWRSSQFCIWRSSLRCSVLSVRNDKSFWSGGCLVKRGGFELLSEPLTMDLLIAAMAVLGLLDLCDDRLALLRFMIDSLSLSASDRRLLWIVVKRLLRVARCSC